MKRAVLIALVLSAAAITFAVPRQPAQAAACRPSLSTLVLSPATVPGGATGQVTVSLSCQPANRVAVHLAGFTGVTVPRTVHVNAHHTTTTATISTATSTAARHGRIRAHLGASRLSAALTVSRTPATCRFPRLTSLTMPAHTYVGVDALVRIGLSCATAAAVRVTLRSTSSFLPTPRTITIGRYYAGTTVLLRPEEDGTGEYAATVTARDHGRSRSRTITIDPGLAQVQLLGGGDEPDALDLNVLFTGQIPAGGDTVDLASSSPALVVPATYSFQQSSAGGGVPITTEPVTTNTTVTVSVTFGGLTRSASAVLLPAFGPGDTVTLIAQDGPGPIYGQEFDLEYYATLSNPAPAAGANVTFSSTDPSLELQQTSDDVTPGFNNGYVDIDTANVTSPVHASLTATVDGISATLPITIEPGLAAITLPASVTGGDSFTGTVSLAGPVDAPTTVALQSTQGILTVPGLVTIPAGHSSATFTGTTTAVTTDSPVSVVARLGTTTLQSADVTLTP